MTADPIPFINSLKRESDGFANGVTIAGLGTAGLMLGWMTVAHLGWVNAPSEGVKDTARLLMLGWLTFFGLAALIDYTIFAVTRACTEWLLAAIRSIIEYQSAEQEPTSAPLGTPDQRESTVAYLHDLLKRSDQAPADVSPLNPNPAA